MTIWKGNSNIPNASSQMHAEVHPADWMDNWNLWSLIRGSMQEGTRVAIAIRIKYRERWTGALHQ